MARAKAIGKSGSLTFKMSDFRKGKTVAERMRGRLMICVHGKPIWVSDDGSGIEWTWDSLLEHLSAQWVDIFYEEKYPGGLTPVLPSQIWQEVRKITGPQESSEVSPSLLDAVFEFELSHNLALMVDGIELPSIRFMKMGKLMVVDASRPEYNAFNHDVVQILDVKDFFKGICENLLDCISDLEDDRAEYLRGLWGDRDRGGNTPLALLYGINSEEADTVEA